MWTWDSTEITFDQECWTFDGLSECEGAEAGAEECIFFTLYFTTIVRKTLKL